MAVRIEWNDKKFIGDFEAATKKAERLVAEKIFNRAKLNYYSESHPYSKKGRMINALKISETIIFPSGLIVGVEQDNPVWVESAAGRAVFYEYGRSRSGGRKQASSDRDQPGRPFVKAAAETYKNALAPALRKTTSELLE